MTTVSRPVRVVIVDDTPDIRTLVGLTLRLSGDDFTVVGEAGDGAEAVDVARRLQPDIVLLDLAMPVMDGLEALPLIRRESPESRVLVLSGFNARELGDEAMRAGASGYMEKGGIATRLIPRLYELVGADGPAGDGESAARSEPERDAAHDTIALLAHELLSPVNVLNGYASALTRAARSMSPDTIEQAASAIVRSAFQVTALVHTLVDLQSVEVDSLDLRTEPSDVAELVRECVNDVATLTADHQVIVDVVPGMWLDVDPVRIRQILVNLIGNATKFTPPGSRVWIGMALADMAEVWIEDEGPGIPPARRHELFTKFARLGSSHSGTGLGLFLSRAIARAHGGDLVLADRRPGRDPGRGCRFVLRLPLG